MTFEIWVIEGIFTEEDPGIATGHDEAPQSHYQGVLQPPVGDTFKSLHDTSVSAVPRKTKHHHCGDFWVEITSCENKRVRYTARPHKPTWHTEDVVAAPNLSAQYYRHSDEQIMFRV